jgi:transposase
MNIVPKAYSKDLRERVVKSYNDGVGTIPQIAKLFNISVRTVNKYLNVHRTTGDLAPGKSTGRPPFLTEDKLKIIKKIILSKPDDRLEDYCITFEKTVGVSIPKSTFWDACQILNIKRKKKFFCGRTRTA